MVLLKVKVSCPVDVLPEAVRFNTAVYTLVLFLSVFAFALRPVVHYERNVVPTRWAPVFINKFTSIVPVTHDDRNGLQPPHLDLRSLGKNTHVLIVSVFSASLSQVCNTHRLTLRRRTFQRPVVIKSMSFLGVLDQTMLFIENSWSACSPHFLVLVLRYTLREDRARGL